MLSERLREIPEPQRNAAVEKLTDYILENDPNASDYGPASEFVQLFIEIMDVNQRRQLAERFARADNAPRAIVRQFVCDNVVAAEPVLRWSKLVDAQLLKEVIDQIDNQSLQVVAQRSDLTDDTMALLIDSGDARARASLAHNCNVTLSDALVAKLLQCSQNDVAVEEALCGREDLPEEAGQMLMRRVSRRLREEVGSVAESLDEPALRLALRTTDSDHADKDSDTQGLSLDAFTTIMRLSRSGRLGAEHLKSFIESGDMGAVIACFANIAGIQATVARRLILQPSNEGLAVAARAAKLDRSVFQAIVDLKKSLKISDEVQSHSGTDFDEVEVDTAERVMNFHSARRTKITTFKRAS